MPAQLNRVSYQAEQMKNSFAGLLVHGIVVRLVRALKHPTMREAVRFGAVGSLGVVVDMSCLAVVQGMGWVEGHLSLCKLAAAELALLTNFCFSERWVFRSGNNVRSSRGWLRRLAWFQLVCGVGLITAAFLLKLFHLNWRWNLWFSNLSAIVIVASLNFALVRVAYVRGRLHQLMMGSRLA